MKLIVETDIGHDPDDFFALCYLFSAGIDIKAILISPGDESQIAVVDFMLRMLDKHQEVAIGVPEIGRRKEQPTNIHKALLDKYKFPYFSSKAYESQNLIFNLLAKNDDMNFFGCGPLKNIGKFPLTNSILRFDRATMQGGFIGYDVHGLPVPRLTKFEGKIKVPTFNLGGYKQGALNFLQMNIKDRRFVSKNVCHGVTYDKTVHDIVRSIPASNRASELLREGMDLRFQSNPEGKVFHDPTAAVCHLHPEIATWVKAKLYYEKGEWGANLDENGDKIIIDIHKEKLWQHIAEGV
jgi:inosine-uridine nucleoside N-ribohydrolase